MDKGDRKQTLSLSENDRKHFPFSIYFQVRETDRKQVFPLSYTLVVSKLLLSLKGYMKVHHSMAYSLGVKVTFLSHYLFLSESSRKHFAPCLSFE